MMFERGRVCHKALKWPPIVLITAQLDEAVPQSDSAKARCRIRGRKTASDFYLIKAADGLMCRDRR